MIVYLAFLAIQVACIVDVVRNRRNFIWITALIFLPIASAAAYLIVEVYPRMRHNRHVRHARTQIAERIDPERELRAAREALAVAKTAANRERLAEALLDRGRYAEAVSYLRDSIGHGRANFRTGEMLANALFMTDRNDEALELLDSMAQPSVQADRDRIQLLRAQILEELGRNDEAGSIYRDLVGRYPGDEVRCRYAALLIKNGHVSNARRLLEDVEERLKRMDRARRAGSAQMYDWAMKTLGELRA